jgi:hypothetical protein
LDHNHQTAARKAKKSRYFIVYPGHKKTYGKSVSFYLTTLQYLARRSEDMNACTQRGYKGLFKSNTGKQKAIPKDG